MAISAIFSGRTSTVTSPVRDPLSKGDALAEDFGLCAVGMAGQTIGQADEGCHVFSCRLTVQRHRVGNLLDTPVIHHANPIGDRQSLFLVMGDEHRRCPGFDLDAPDFVTQLDTHFRIESG